MVEDNAIQEFVDAIKEPEQDTNRTYSAIVSKVDQEGTVWVHLVGSEKETPTASTSTEVQKGDAVTVEWRNNKLYIAGNYSNPAVGMARVVNVEMAAQVANQAAQNAVHDAGRARDAADSAQSSATEAKTIAEGVEDIAESARTAADSAMYNLSIVEDVIGTVNWIAKHGIYKACTEEKIIDGKLYYTLTGMAIANPMGNPSANGYYELIDSKYELSEDVEVDEQKTYYQVTAAHVAEPSGNPSAIPYYELGVDEAVVQYINTHLTLTNNGLRVTDGSQNSMLISSDGVTIYAKGKVAGQYGEGAIIGDPDAYHIEISGTKLSFINGAGDLATEIAYMQYDRLYIPKVVVIDSMKAGNWIWDAQTAENHFTLKWEG